MLSLASCCALILQAGVIWQAICKTGARLDLLQVSFWTLKETPMHRNLDLLRQVLKLKLDEAVATTGSRDSIRIHQVADPIDMTQQAAEREMAMQNLHRGAALVRQLRSAMERLEDDSYGICLQCEEPISLKRLTAVPWAAFCIDCQETADRSRQFNSDTRELPEAA
jgi:RNA polymerase-binding transcription factor